MPIYRDSWASVFCTFALYRFGFGSCHRSVLAIEYASIGEYHRRQTNRRNNFPLPVHFLGKLQCYLVGKVCLSSASSHKRDGIVIPHSHFSKGQSCSRLSTTRTRANPFCDASNDCFMSSFFYSYFVTNSSSSLNRSGAIIINTFPIVFDSPLLSMPHPRLTARFSRSARRLHYNQLGDGNYVGSECPFVRRGAPSRLQAEGATRSLETAPQGAGDERQRSRDPSRCSGQAFDNCVSMQVR